MSSNIFTVKRSEYQLQSGIIKLMIVMYLGNSINRTGSSSLGVTICWGRNYFSGQLFE